MDHIGVVKRAWEITWRYRALWIFGIILALTTASAGSGGGGGQGSGSWNGFQYKVDDIEDFSGLREELRRDLGEEIEQLVETLERTPEAIAGPILITGICLACVAVLLSVVGAIARWVAEAALILMVDTYEETGEKRTVRQGFRMGWSRTAWRLFLINLLVKIPVALVMILVFLLALSPGLLWLTRNVAVGVVGTVAAAGLFFLAVFLAVIVGIVLPLLMRFFRRACALEGLGVIDSIHSGYLTVRHNLKDIAIMWLIMLGLGVAWLIVMIPTMILVAVAALAIAAVPALGFGWLAGLALGAAAQWIAGIVVGLLIFAVVIAIPGLFLSGLVEVFKSSVWTLTYRDVQAIGALGDDSELGSLERTAPEEVLDATEQDAE